MNRVREVEQLLRDYRNDLSEGNKGHYKAYDGDERGWPLSEEAVRRLDKTTLVGESYANIDRALAMLEREFPEGWLALQMAYIEDGCGHGDVNRWRTLAHEDIERRKGQRALANKLTKKLPEFVSEDTDISGWQVQIVSPHATTWTKLVRDHDRAVQMMSEYLEVADLFVNWPLEAIPEDPELDYSLVTSKTDEMYFYYREARKRGLNHEDGLESVRLRFGLERIRVSNVINARLKEANEARRATV